MSFSVKKQRWILPECDPVELRELELQQQLSPLFARCLLPVLKRSLHTDLLATIADKKEISEKEILDQNWKGKEEFDKAAELLGIQRNENTAEGWKSGLLGESRNPEKSDNYSRRQTY